MGFEEEWNRRWYASELGDAAYGQKSIIGRIRRGRYVRIPPEWRGKVPNSNQMRKRASNYPKKYSRGARKAKGIPAWPSKGENRLTLQERKAALDIAEQML